jgi:hypothetical protein
MSRCQSGDEVGRRTLQTETTAHAELQRWLVINSGNYKSLSLAGACSGWWGIRKEKAKGKFIRDCQ